jgi:hypothetical protein
MNEQKAASRSIETRTVVNGVEYIIESFFKEDARETAKQKLLRLVRECVAAEINNTESAVNSSNELATRSVLWLTVTH